jgi:hypothetical protein
MRVNSPAFAARILGQYHLILVGSGLQSGLIEPLAASGEWLPIHAIEELASTKYNPTGPLTIQLTADELFSIESDR